MKGFVTENNQDVFDFKVRPWTSLAKMKAQTKKTFCDRLQRAENRDQPGQANGKDAQSCKDGGEYSETRGLMNRRVDIAIVETPYCMI